MDSSSEMLIPCLLTKPHFVCNFVKGGVSPGCVFHGHYQQLIITAHGTKQARENRGKLGARRVDGRVVLDNLRMEGL